MRYVERHQGQARRISSRDKIGKEKVERMTEFHVESGNKLRTYCQKAAIFENRRDHIEFSRLNCPRFFEENCQIETRYI